MTPSRRAPAVVGGRRGYAVRAGPLSAVLVGANLRTVRAGDLDLVQRIYVAVRDTVWNVIPARVRITERTIGEDYFELRFRARHRDGGLDFAWGGRISGSPEGQIRYTMDGRARSSFRYNKIGILVVHPTVSHVGRTLAASGGPDGSFVATFPSHVGPQVVRDGRLWGLFTPFRSLAIQLDGGVLNVTFDGDDFEMEDERNWTESGFKTYSGPIANPWPMTAEPGMRVRQAVTLAYRGSTPQTDRRHVPGVTVGSQSSSRLPLIGHSVPSLGDPPTAAETSLLRLADPSFIHADLLFDDGAQAHLERVSSTVAAANRPLLASIYIGPDPARDIDRFMSWCASASVSLQGVVLCAQQPASTFGVGTPPEIAQEVVPRLRVVFPGVPIAVGSDRFLSEVIRSNPTTHGADAIAFGISPSGHADEDWAIIENLPAQGDAVRTLRAHLGTTPIFAGPITLQTRFGGWARGPHRPGELPRQVDVRQRSLLAGAWTLGSVRELTLAGAALAIYYETVGWRGLVEREEGGCMPARFRSKPLEAFPMFHVLADIGEAQGMPVWDTEIEGQVSALAFGIERPSTVLVANLAATATSIHLGPLPGRRARLRILDRRSIAAARGMPRRFRQRSEELNLRAGTAQLEVGPYGYARVDIPAATAGGRAAGRPRDAHA